MQTEIQEESENQKRIREGTYLESLLTLSFTSVLFNDHLKYNTLKVL